MLTSSHKGQALAYSSLIKKCPDFRLSAQAAYECLTSQAEMMRRAAYLPLSVRSTLLGTVLL